MSPEPQTMAYAFFIGIYTVVLAFVTLRHARRIKTAEDFLVGNWNVGFWQITATTFATACGAAAFIGFVGLGYYSGVSGIAFWIVPGLAFTCVLAFVFGSSIRKLSLYTVPDAFALRFGKNAAFLPGLFQVLVFSIPTLAIQYVGIGTIFTTFFGWSLQWGILLGFATVAAITLLGGLTATIETDVIQSTLLVLGLFCLFFFGLNQAGGLEQVAAQTPSRFWSPLGGGTLMSFLFLALTIGPFYLISPTTWHRLYAAKNEKAAVWGVALGGILAGAIQCLSFFSGIFARNFLSPDTRPDMVFAQSIPILFSPIFGALVVSALLAALMSSADSYTMTGAASLARDFYKQYLRPQADSASMLAASRIGVALISGCALAIALIGKNIIPIYILTVKTAGAGLVFPFLALMLWKRATRKGILWAMSSGALVTLGWHFLTPWPEMDAAAGYLVSLAAVVGVSLATSHAAEEQVRAAYFDPLEPRPVDAFLKTERT